MQAAQGGRAEPMAQKESRTNRDLRICDPRPTTPFEMVAEHGLLRLRRYAPEAPLSGVAPVLLVYPMIKRPYVLDLLPQRSVVRNLLQQGFTVYLTDWRPPRLSDRGRGFHEYVDSDLAGGVDVIRAREAATRVTLVGSCCGGLLAAVYAAFNPESVDHLVTVAAPFAAEPPFAALMAEQIVLTYGNVPAWMVEWVLNARMRDPRQTAFQLARDLGEPELANYDHDHRPALLDAIKPWLDSDVPLAGRLFLDVVRDAWPGSNLLEGRMRVGGRRVDLANIDCPVLAIAGEHDALVPPAQAAWTLKQPGGRDAINLRFPVGHLGLMLSRSAQERLWPEVGAWLRTGHLAPVRQIA